MVIVILVTVIPITCLAWYRENKYTVAVVANREGIRKRNGVKKKDCLWGADGQPEDNFLKLKELNASCVSKLSQ